MSKVKPNFAIVSFRLTPDEFRLFKAKLPKHGERSKALSKFVELFNRNKINLEHRMTMS